MQRACYCFSMNFKQSCSQPNAKHLLACIADAAVDSLQAGALRSTMQQPRMHPKPTVREVALLVSAAPWGQWDCHVMLVYEDEELESLESEEESELSCKAPQNHAKIARTVFSVCD